MVTPAMAGLKRLEELRLLLHQHQIDHDCPRPCFFNTLA